MLTENEIDKKAVETWGARLQKVVAIEELSELQKAICKDLRMEGIPPKDDRIFNAISEEMADVEVMLNQLKYIYGNEECVKYYKQLKLEKVSRWLNKNNEPMPLNSKQVSPSKEAE